MWLGKLYRVFTGQRLRANRERRAREDEAIREALVDTQQRRIENLGKEIAKESDPRRKKILEHDRKRRQVQLTEAQQMLRGLGL